MKKLRKALIVGVMGITVLAMSVVVAPEASAAVAGDLIKMDGLSSVYFLAGDSKRYVFPNEATYFSWYSDFSGVVTIPQSELESYPLGANVTVRPGTKLVKITTDPKVYAVEPDGMLVHVPDETTAIALWGENWAQRVIDVPDAFFTNYTVTGSEVSADAYPAGSLVMLPGEATVYYIGSARAITSEAAFLANRFKWDDVITAPEGFVLPAAGADITGAEADIIDTSSGAGGSAGAGTGLTVALSGDTSAAESIPGSSPISFLIANLTASSDGDVNLNSLKINAYDLGSAVNIDSVGIFLSGVKQGTSKNMTADREVVFNFTSPIAIPAGTTVSLEVRATIGTASGNYALGIASASGVLTNGAVVSGSFPIIGNTKAVVSGTNIGTVTLASAVDTDQADVEFGTDDILLAEFNLTSANEPILWESARFRNAGTNNADIVENLRIFIDGDEVATGEMVDKFATFDLENYVIAKGDTVSVEVYGDMGIGNVGNTLEFYVKDADDLVFTGQTFGYGILADVTDLDHNPTTEGVKVTLAASDFTINIDKSATPAADVRAGTDNVVLATIKMTSHGENAVSDGITGTAADDEFIIAGTGLLCDEFDNAELYDVDSGTLADLTVASSTATTNTCYLVTTEEFAFVKGVTRTFQVRVDLQGANDDNTIDDNDTLKVTLEDGALSLTGDESDATITATPAEVSGAIMTVKAASLTWTNTPLTDKTVVPGAEEVVIYQASVKAGASSDVTVTSIKLDADDTSLFEPFDDENFASINAYLDGKLIKATANKIQTDHAAGAYITFSSLNTTNRVIPAGTTVDLVVKAYFAGSFPTYTGDFALEVTAAASVIARDIDSNTFDVTVANGGVNSRAVTLAADGDLTVELKVDDQKANLDTYILAGSETTQDRYIGELVFTTANEPIKVKTLALAQNGTAENDDILAVRLYDKDGAYVAQEGVDSYGHVYFDTFNYELPADKATSLFIGIVAKTILAEGDTQATADYRETVQFSIASSGAMVQLGETSGTAAVTAQGVNSSEDLTLTRNAGTGTVGTNEYDAATTTSRSVMITGSVLTSVVNAMADGALPATGNDKTIGKYTFVFDNGTNQTSTGEELKAKLGILILSISTTSATQVSNIKAYIDTDTANKTAGDSVLSGKATIDFATDLGDLALVDGAITLTIVGDIVTTGAVGQSLETEINALATDFTYYGDNGAGGTILTNTRLDYTEVLGANLSK